MPLALPGVISQLPADHFPALLNVAFVASDTEPTESEPTRPDGENPDEPLLHYNLACYWSLVGNAPKSVRSLLAALELNPELHRLVARETDFDPIRGEAEFARLVSGPQPTV